MARLRTSRRNAGKSPRSRRAISAAAGSIAGGVATCAWAERFAGAFDRPSLLIVDLRQHHGQFLLQGELGPLIIRIGKFSHAILELQIAQVLVNRGLALFQMLRGRDRIGRRNVFGANEQREQTSSRPRPESPRRTESFNPAWSDPSRFAAIVSGSMSAHRASAGAGCPRRSRRITNTTMPRPISRRIQIPATPMKPGPDRQNRSLPFSWTN